MKTKTIKLQVPHDASQLTLGQYIDFMIDSEGIKDDKKIDLLILKHFYDIDPDDLGGLKGKDVATLIDAIKIILGHNTWPLIREFSIDGMDFGFIPDLEEATFGEYTDLDSYFGSVQDFHKVAAVLFRPITVKKYDKRLKKNRYEIEEYTTTRDFAEAMRLMPLDAALGGFSFFGDIGAELLSFVPSYLEKQIASSPEAMQLLKDLDQNGDGSEHITASVEEILQSLKLSENLITLKPLPPLPFKSTKTQRKQQ